jgi:hypothetical protein
VLEGELDGLDAVLRLDDLEALALEHAGHDPAQGGAVIRDHDGRHGALPVSAADETSDHI